jgi:hypothetical protein
MITEQEEKICLFCLETKKGRKQHKSIEFKALFPCECIFQSHAECIIKWQIHCLDEIQCPICRVHLIVPEEEHHVGALVVYHPVDPTGAIGKKFIFFAFFYVLSILILFTFLGIRL